MRVIRVIRVIRFRVIWVTRNIRVIRVITVITVITVISVLSLSTYAPPCCTLLLAGTRGRLYPRVENPKVEQDQASEQVDASLTNRPKVATLMGKSKDSMLAEKMQGDALGGKPKDCVMLKGDVLAAKPKLVEKPKDSATLAEKGNVLGGKLKDSAKLKEKSRTKKSTLLGKCKRMFHRIGKACAVVGFCAWLFTSFDLNSYCSVIAGLALERGGAR
jgi:hypothetical protein